MPRRRHVVVGASVAGLRTAEALHQRSPDSEIVVIGTETHLPYDRPPLSKGFLSGDVVELALPYLDGLTFRLGTTATAADSAAHTVTLDNGSTIDYDGLVIATGTRPIIPPSLDMNIHGVHLLRTIDDARGLRNSLHTPGRRVVLLGGGFIGGELASTCRKLGHSVTIVDLMSLPLERAMGEDMSKILWNAHRENGTELRFGTAVTGFVADAVGRLVGVNLDNGLTLDADVVVVGVGVRPVTEWLDHSGIDVENGVLCLVDLRSRSVADVVAVGDVARWEHPLFGVSVRIEHWMNAIECADFAARSLLGSPQPCDAIPNFWSDQLTWKIQGVGIPSLADAVTVTEEGGTAFAEYRRNGELVGAVGFGRARSVVAARRELAARATSA